MKKYVIDASLLLKFLLSENLKTEQLVNKFLILAKEKKILLYSSDLLVLEVTNGLRYSLRDVNLAEETLQKFLGLPINYFRFSPAQIGKILKLSYEYQTSVYDTSYHFLAKIIQGIFLTADSEYFKKARRFGDIQLI